MKLSECPVFQKATLRLPTPQPRFVAESVAGNGMVSERGLYLDLDLPHGNNEILLRDAGCDAKIETLRYRARKSGRREAGFVVIRPEPHYDESGNQLRDGADFQFSLNPEPASVGDEGPLYGRVPVEDLYKIGTIENVATNQSFNVPVVTGEPFTNEVSGNWTPQWKGGRMDLYLRFRVSAINPATGIREAGPESVTVRVAPYPYPVNRNGGENTNRLGVGMADGPIYG